MAQLRRELGRWDLTALGINQVIGGAVFAMPATLAAAVGGWSPILIGFVGFASMLIALTFAEVASRFDGTGGGYIYTRAAFGRFPAFEVGWMLWFTRVASWASVINVLVSALGFYWPSVTTGVARTAVMTGIIATLAFINILGIRQSAWVVNTLTVGKLVPLALFIVVGLTAIDGAALHIGSLPPTFVVAQPEIEPAIIVDEPIAELAVPASSGTGSIASAVELGLVIPLPKK